MGRRSSSEDWEWSRAVVVTSGRDVSPILSGVFLLSLRDDAEWTYYIKIYIQVRSTQTGEAIYIWNCDKSGVEDSNNNKKRPSTPI
jgi:hypothetical protein